MVLKDQINLVLWKLPILTLFLPLHQGPLEMTTPTLWGTIDLRDWFKVNEQLLSSFPSLYSLNVYGQVKLSNKIPQ